MRGQQEDTPPSSVNGDEIIGMDEGEEGFFLYDDVEEVQLEELEEMLNAELEEDYTEMETEPPEDHAAFVFNKHVGSVFCCDLHPDGKLAVTGGEDDRAFVWAITDNCPLIMDCLGHKDSIIFAGFSFDGAYLATADMSGLIKVWKCSTNENQQLRWKVAFEYETEDLTWGLWHYAARVLICASVSGDIYVFKVPSGETKVLQGHNAKVECGKLFQDGVRLAAGYEDGAVKIWDLKTRAVLHHVPASVHEHRVTAIDIHPDGNLMASISTNGKVVLTTANNGKVVGQMQDENELETVAFGQDPQLPLLATGTLTGAVSIWDVPRQMIRHHCAKSDDAGSGGVTKMVWAKNQLITGCLDGSVRVYEGRTGEKIQTLTGNFSEVLDLCYNSKENIILTTSDDGTARIFKYEVNKDND